MKKVILLLVAVAFITGCSLTPKVKQVEVSAVAVEKLPLNIDTPPPLEMQLSLIHISEPTRRSAISYAVF